MERRTRERKTMRRILAMLAGVTLFAGAAMANCEDQCNAGFNVCMHNCGGQAGCLERCAHERSGCPRRCGSSLNSTPVPWGSQARFNRSGTGQGVVNRNPGDVLEL